MEKLWIPDNSSLPEELRWLRHESGFPDFRPTVRISSLIVVHPHLLSPDILANLTLFHAAVESLTVEDVIDDGGGGERCVGENCLDDSGSSSVQANLSRPLNFTVSSLLSLWRYDAAVVAASSSQEIKGRIRAARNFTRQLLGGDGGGGDDTRTVSVSKRSASPSTFPSSSSSSASWPESVNATILRWIFDASDLKEEVDDETAFDEAFHKVINRTLSRVTQRLTDEDPRFRFYIKTHGDYERALDESVQSDLYLVGLAYAVVILFVIFNLGSFTRLKHKVWLSLAGVVCVVLAWVAGGGVAAATGHEWGQAHPIIFFLLLGIGIDDMFVVVQAYQNQGGRKKEACREENKSEEKMRKRRKRGSETEEEKVIEEKTPTKSHKEPKANELFPPPPPLRQMLTPSLLTLIDIVEEDDGSCSHEEIAVRLASALSRVGVSITVTTATDVLAFGFGALSSLPTIRSLSIWLTLGMFSIYVLQVVIDEGRG